MKHFVAIFFLITMILNAMQPLMEQLQAKDIYELVEAGGDDADDENKSEKENEKEGEKEQEVEKKSINLPAYLLVRHGDYPFQQFNRSIFPLNELPESELYTSRLELPPEA